MNYYIKKHMKKFIELLKENKCMHYAIVILVGIILSIPLVNIEIRDTHDGSFHLLRLIGSWDAISIGEVPPIIMPEYCYGTGYAMNLFYPPLTTYLPLLLKCIVSTYANVLKIFGALCIIASGITMYNFTYSVTKKRSIALFSAIIYLVSPYKLGNVYKRYAIGEFIALVFLPILFQGLHNLFKGDGKKHYYIAIGTILLMLSHTITTFYAAILCFIYLLFYINRLKEKKIIKKLAVNLMFILLITTLFWGPMLEAKQSASYIIFSDSYMRTTSEYTYQNSLELFEFIWDVGEENATTYTLGIPIILLFLASIYAIRKVNLKYKDLYIAFILLGIVSLYMATKYFPWFIMPNVLCKLQYPWRMVGFFNFFSSLICGINIYILINQFVKKDYLKTIVATILIVLIILYTLPIIIQYKTININRDEEYEQSILLNPQISHMRINRDYLPIKAGKLQSTYMHTKQDNKAVVLEGKVEIGEQIKEKLTMRIYIANSTKGACIEFPFLYYPGYKAWIIADGALLEADTFESDNGYVAVELPQYIRDGKIFVEYTITPITKLSYVVSAISLLAFLIYIYKEKKKVGEKNV